jgi:hypothetical protein
LSRHLAHGGRCRLRRRRLTEVERRVAAAVDQIESICSDAAAKVDASRGEFPVADFDPENPNPAELAARMSSSSTSPALGCDV